MKDPIPYTPRAFTEAQLSNGRLSGPLTEKELAPLQSVDFEGSSLASLLSERTQDEKRREWEVGRKIDAALTEYQELKGGMDGKEWQLLRMLLMGHLS